jgi:ABC-2 type transport system permease protein
MLWYKSWVETRLRLWIALGLTGILLAGILLALNIRPPAQPGPKPTLGTFFLWMMCVTFPGAGIKTQRVFGFSKGLHGSTQYTLSLPVSRFQLLAVRAGLGWLEMAGVTGTFCFGTWLVAPVLFQGVTGFEMFEYVVTVIACASAPYFLSVLLLTFLDDQWRQWGAMIACISIGGLPYLIRVPAYADIPRAMGEGSPLVAHATPWPAMAFSLALAAILFFAALKIVQRQEF